MRYCLLAVVLLTTSSVRADELSAGVASSDITPPVGYRMSGYFSERVNTGKHDSLWTKALVFKQGKVQVALVYCDLIGISLDVSMQARRAAAKETGIPADNILIAATQPNHGEQAMNICEMLVRSNAVDIVVIDSVAALIPQKELEGEIGDTHVGLQARLMSQSMRRLTGAIAKSKTCVVFINQIREKIGVMFGSPETTPGGRALKFYSTCHIDVRKIGQLKDGEEVVGQRVRAKVVKNVKNKVAPPFRLAEFDMMHSDEISYEGDILDMALAAKYVVRSGAWFRYGDVQLGQGREKARLYLKENPEVTQNLREEVLAAGGHHDLLSGIDAPEGTQSEEETETVSTS